jgi:hypothetical protein
VLGREAASRPPCAAFEAGFVRTLHSQFEWNRCILAYRLLPYKQYKPLNFSLCRPT